MIRNLVSGQLIWRLCVCVGGGGGEGGREMKV